MQDTDMNITKNNNVSVPIIDVQKIKELVDSKIEKSSIDFNQFQQYTNFKFQSTDTLPPKIDKNGIYYDTSDEEDDSTDEEAEEEEEDEEEMVDEESPSFHSGVLKGMNEHPLDEYFTNIEKVVEIVAEYQKIAESSLIYIVIININDKKFIKYGYTDNLYNHLMALVKQLCSEYDKVRFGDLVGLLKLDDSRNKIVDSRRCFSKLFPSEKCLEKRFEGSYYRNYTTYSDKKLVKILMDNYSKYCDMVYLNKNLTQNLY